jgi:GntR family transcriptional regulator/MocR family aminotransferase
MVQIKEPRIDYFYVPLPSMTKPLNIELDRSAKTSLAEQIRKGITSAIEGGVLLPGARLPSWLDLAAQLGVARGTVRLAYERLMDAQLITASRATGTRVADRPRILNERDESPDHGSFMDMYQELMAGPAIFQMGVPAQETLPAKLFTRIHSYAIRAELSKAALYPDPRGEPELRREIAAYLAIARGLECSPSQIFVTGGFSSGLGLTMRVLGLQGQKAWVEDPSFPITKHGLGLAGLSLAPIPVDDEGIDIDYGMRTAADAALCVVTPGQQAPLGMTMSLARRLQLLDWAAQKEQWVIEDDYLSELQLGARAAPALASLDRAGRVIHIGSFSKTITPTLRLGFIVSPPSIASRFAEVAACLAPAPIPAVQLATAEFMRDGHYIRHLRRTKRLYSAQQDALQNYLEPRVNGIDVATAGLAALLYLPDGTDDISLVRETLAYGLAPAPLSAWYASPASARSGLLLGISTAPQQHIGRACDRLLEILERYKKH